MIAVLGSKWVGDQFTGGIYDCYINIRNYPFLHEPDDIHFTPFARNVMDEELDCLVCEPEVQIDTMLKDLKRMENSGFPLIQSKSDRTLIGFVHKKQLKDELEKQMQNQAITPATAVSFSKFRSGDIKNAIDISHCVDTAVLRVVPDTPLAQVYNIFRQLGVAVIMVVSKAELCGMITKKKFIAAIHDHHIGHAKDEDESGALSQGLGTPLLQP